MATTAPKRNRSCPYHGHCLDYGDCQDCDHGIAYNKFFRKVSNLKEKLENDQFIVVEANNTDYELSVFGPFRKRKEAEQFIYERYVSLTAEYKSVNSFVIEESSCSEDGYTVLCNGDVTYGRIKAISFNVKK